MIVIVRSVHGTEEIVVTVKKHEDKREPQSTSSITILNAKDEIEAAVEALKCDSIIKFLKE